MSAEIGDNSQAGTELRQFIERIERLEEEIKDINADKSDVYGEAKGRGYDAKIIKKVVALRRRDRDQVREENTILNLYLQALGMQDYVGE